MDVIKKKELESLKLTLKIIFFVWSHKINSNFTIVFPNRFDSYEKALEITVDAILLLDKSTENLFMIYFISKWFAQFEFFKRKKISREKLLKIEKNIEKKLQILRHNEIINFFNSNKFFCAELQDFKDKKWI